MKNSGSHILGVTLAGSPEKVRQHDLAFQGETHVSCVLCVTRCRFPRRCVVKKCDYFREMYVSNVPLFSKAMVCLENAG